MANFFYTSFSPQNFLYWMIYFMLTVAFTYVYTDIMFRQQNLPDTLQRQGGFIPGIRPGPAHRAVFEQCVGAHYAGGGAFSRSGRGAALSRGPRIPGGGVGSFNTLIISSTGLLIVVGVVLDTMKQIEAQLMMRNYEGFIR